MRRRARSPTRCSRTRSWRHSSTGSTATTVRSSWRACRSAPRSHSDAPGRRPAAGRRGLHLASAPRPVRGRARTRGAVFDFADPTVRLHVARIQLHRPVMPGRHDGASQRVRATAVSSTSAQQRRARLGPQALDDVRHRPLPAVPAGDAAAVCQRHPRRSAAALIASHCSTSGREQADSRELEAGRCLVGTDRRFGARSNRVHRIVGQRGEHRRERSGERQRA